MSDTTRDRCVWIINDFDRWLALQVRIHRLSWEELPQLNDMFRAYFSDTRTAQKEEP